MSTVAFQQWQSESEPTLTLRSFPDQPLVLDHDAHVFVPQVAHGQPVCRQTWVQRCAAEIATAIATTGTNSGRSVESLLLILPDKTRTQMAANVLVDGVLALLANGTDVAVTLLYGLGTHPFMDAADLEKLLGSDRYRALQARNIPIHQQSTKAVTNPMTFVSVWQDNPNQEIFGKRIKDLKEPLLMAWANANRHGARLWVGLFPSVVRQRWEEVVELLRSLQANRQPNAQPIELDCRDPDLNRVLRAALEPDAAEVIHIPVTRLELAVEPEANLDIRFLDRHGETGVCLRTGERYLMEVPEYLLTHDLTIVAGDTRIHPYEGRYGSGGINKMLAVGIASLNEIRRSHSTRILTHPLTCAGEPRSPFVQRVAATARSIRDTMLTHPNTRSLAAPYGLTMIGKSEEDIWGMAFSQHESARRELAATLTQRYTVPIARHLDVVVSDVEPYKGTDITAGARALQYLCDWHRPDNVLLNRPDRGCVALLFNPCNEPKNNAGIGNDGTKLHMDVLGDFLQGLRPQLSRNLEQARSLTAVQQTLTIARQTVLARWQQHLCSNSEVTDWLEELQRLAYAGQQQASHGQVPRDMLKFLYERMDRYRRGANHVNRAIARIEYEFQRSQNWGTLIHALKDLATLYQEHEGLGEGGQRTLRLLKLCRTFKTLLFATDRPAVLDYLDWLDPEVTDDLPDSLRAQFHRQGIRASVLGLVPVNLNQVSVNEAMHRAIAYGRWHKPQTPQLALGVLTCPLILKNPQQAM